MQPTDKVPVDYNELKRSLVMVVGKSGLAAEAAGKHGVVILLDALNQLDVAGRTPCNNHMCQQWHFSGR